MLIIALDFRKAVLDMISGKLDINELLMIIMPEDLFFFDENELFYEYKNDFEIAPELAREKIKKLILSQKIKKSKKKWNKSYGCYLVCNNPEKGWVQTDDVINGKPSSQYKRKDNDDKMNKKNKEQEIDEK